MSNFGVYFPLKNPTTFFVVKNIAKNNKRIKIFQYPIKNGDTRDLLDIPGVTESIIRASLLKGELLHKIKSKEIVVVKSNIDLLQFSDDQKAFLQEAGITKGLEVDVNVEVTAEIPFLFRQNVALNGVKNGTNRTFTTPEKFINGSYLGQDFRILIRFNGRGLEQNVDYTLIESGGVGTGYDTIVFISLIPEEIDRLVVDYVIKA